tara:strand:- start:1584 stop:1994 length:411 start_codon:yes stop_codon:yes gene_type:complete
MKNIINNPLGYTFYHNIMTRWKDMDAFKHINNAMYLTYIEDARTQLFDRWNINNKERSVIVASVKIDYLKQISHPSKLTIASKISKIGNSSFDIQSAIFKNDNKSPSAVSIVTCVCYNYNNNKSIPVYSEIKLDKN